MKNKLLLLVLLGIINIPAYSQWTDITSTIGGITSTTNMSKPYVFDLNNDNYPDFLVPVLTTVASPYTKYWRLYKNNGNSTFTDATTSYGLPTNLSLSTLGFIDYNGDGFKDLYFITATGLQIFKNNNGTSFTDVSTQLGIVSAFFTSGETTSTFKVFDYDLDGDEDLLYTRTVSGANTLTAIVNNGSSFSTKVNILTSIPGGSAGINFSFFDMDNDGDFDIVFDGFSTTSQYSNGITTLYRKDATGYTNTTSTSGIVNGLPGEISTVDINQDGNIDIVKGGADCCSSPLYRVFNGNGAGIFTEQTTTYTISNGGYKGSPTLADFDNDTDFDFSWSSYTSTGAAPFRLYANNGSSVFTEMAATYGLNLGVTSGGVPIDDFGNGVWLDIDKDGDLDIILNREGNGSTSTTGNVWVKRNPIQGNYINIKLNGCGVNKSGVGAKIKLVVGTNTKWLYYEKSPDGNASNGTDIFHFGLGTATLVNSITVYWPNNTTTVLNNVSANQFLTIGGGAGSSSAPTGSTSQTLCSGSTIADLTAIGSNIQWYSTSTGGTALASTMALVNGTTYYASQTVSGCESTTRLAVTVSLNNPTISASATTICSGQSTILTASNGSNNQNLCAILSNTLVNGLKAWYPFCGNANDESINGNNGNVIGATLTNDRFGNINSAYSFSNNQQITIPGTENKNYYPLTISLWYNPSNYPTGGQTNVFSKYVSASWNGFQVVYADNTNIPNNGTTVNNGFGTQSWYARNFSNRVIGYYGSPGFLQSNVIINSWYHYVFVIDSTGGKIYVNGQLISTDTWDGTPGVSTNNYLWKIGGQYGGSLWYNGKIDDIGIWNRTLTQSEIQDLYNLSSSTYLWSTGDTTTTINVNPTQTTTYYCTVSNGTTSCTNSVTVTVNPLPTNIFAQDTIAACGTSYVLSAGTGFSNYNWSTGDTTSSISVNNSGWYVCNVTNSSGCTASDTIYIAINALPTVTANASATTVCAGASVTLTGGGANTYTWSGGVTDNISFVPTTTTTYTVTGTDINGCSNTATQTITVNALPTVTANASATSVCTGTSVTLTGGGANTYIWSGGVANGVSFVPTATTTYTVTTSNAIGCTNTATQTITVNALPTVTANASATNVCTGNSITLTGGGASTYTWSGGVTNGVSFIPTVTTTYTVTGTDVNGCKNTASKTINMNILPTLVISASKKLYCQTDASGILTGNPVGGVWSGIGVSGNTFNPTVAGLGSFYAVYTFTATNGCTNKDSLLMTVSTCLGIEEAPSANLFSVYPNPTTSEINVKTDVQLIGSDFVLYDNAGNVLRRGKIKSANTLIKLSDYSAGVYYFTVVNPLYGKHSIKVIKK